MSQSVLSLLCLALWLIPGGERKHTERKETPPSPEFTRLLGFIGDGGVEKLEILHIPRGLDTPIRITAEAFRRMAAFKVTVSDFQRMGDNKSLSKALKDSSVARGGPKYDVRWAIVFYDRWGAQRGAIYLDEFGREGQLGNFVFKPGPHLIPWINSLIKYGFQ
jgi:hypothetical protein